MAKKTPKATMVEIMGTAVIVVLALGIMTILLSGALTGGATISTEAVGR